MINTKLKIALLGVSHWHVPLYLPGLPENSVVAVSDDNEHVANDYGSRYNCPAYKNYRQMISEVKPDFVFAFAPHNQMKEVAEYLLKENIPFSIEKPAGLNAGEVETLYNYAERKRSFCAIPFVWRYSDTVNDLKTSYITSDIVHMSYKFVAGPPSRYIYTSPWMLSRKTAGGGCMTNLGVHFIDMGLYLTGSNSANILSSIYQYGKEYDIEIFASSMLRLENGASLVLECGYAYPMSADSKRENRWSIVTEDGYYTLADNNLEIRKLTGEPKNVPINTDSDVYYEIYTRTTLNDYITGNKPRASLKEMLIVRGILDSIDKKAIFECG